MPGFVKTPKDESRWAKAKEAAGKSASKDSDSYWRLSNYIYHRMGKTEEDSTEAKICYAKMNKEEQELVKSETNIDVSSENLKSFSMNDMRERQSYSSKRGFNMSEEKKYSPREAAVTVLKKAEELLKNSEVLNKSYEGFKAVEESAEKSGASDPAAVAASIGRKKYGKKAFQEAAEAGKKMKKDENTNSELNKAEPVGEIHPKEPQAGESENPGERIKEQVAPDMNPKENAEGNNKEWGTAPETYGTLKLAKFLGHMESKRKSKQTPEAK